MRRPWIEGNREIAITLPFFPFREEPLAQVDNEIDVYTRKNRANDFFGSRGG